MPRFERGSNAAADMLKVSVVMREPRDRPTTEKGDKRRKPRKG